MKTLRSAILLGLGLIALSCGKDDADPIPQNAVPIIEAQSFSISEAAADTDVIGTVKASDSDLDDELTFSITDNDDDLFEITSSGELSLTTGSSLDFETKASHSITVEVTDGEDKASASITINVVDVNENTAPTIATQTFSIAENNAVDAIVGQIVATDAEGDALTFTWPGDPDGRVLSVEANGEIKALEALNFEGTATYTLNVSVSDGSLSNTATITVNVTDVNEAPAFDDNFTFTVPEDAANSSVVGNVTATDPEGASLTYKFVPTGSPNIHFEVASDGTISVHRSNTLDYETATSHTVRVEVTDGSFDVFQDVIINVTDVVEPSGATVSAFVFGANARLRQPAGIAKDNSGNLYIADKDNHTIRKVTPQGVVSNFAGSAFRGYQDGPGNTAQFNEPTGVALDADGNVYVAEQGNHRIRKITPAGVVSTFAGSGTQGLTDGSGTVAEFNAPAGLAIDDNDNLIVADHGNHAIRKIAPSGEVTTLTGNGFSGNSSDKLNNPIAVAAADDGTIYIADRNAVKVLNSSGLSNRAILGNSPYGLAIDKTTNALYITYFESHLIYKVDNVGSEVISGTGNSGFVNGDAANARFNHPWGILVDADGNLFVSDSGNNAIRKITFD